eukprot:2720368-Prymnesium_polylepis.1
MALAKGWSAWYDQYAEHARRHRLLHGAGARLTKPKLVASFKHWFHDWDATQKTQAARSYKERLAEQQARADALEKQLRETRAELAAAREEVTAQKEGGDATAQRMTAELEAEREKRVEHLKQVATRRIGQRELAKGWQGWHDMYMFGRRQRQLLAGA